MRINQPIILALDPGTRTCGVAVFDAAELQYFAIKTLPRRLTQQQLLVKSHQLVMELLEEFQPTTLIVAQKRQRPPVVTAMTRQIQQVAEQYILTFNQYELAEIRLAICSSERATKRHITRRLIEVFPVLRHYEDRPTPWQTLYRQRMFDAIAAGYTDLRESL